MAALELSDLQENATAYAAQLSGDAQTTVAHFGNVSNALSFNTSHPGLCYSVGLLVKVGHTWSRPVRSVPVLTSKNQHSWCRQSGTGTTDVVLRASRLMWSSPPQNLCRSTPHTSWTTRSPQKLEWCLTWSLRLEASSAESTSPSQKEKNEDRCSIKVHTGDMF